MPHPHIIRVRDVFKSKGEIGTTYEWVEGQTLKDKMKEGKMEEKESIRIFVQMCLAM